MSRHVLAIALLLLSPPVLAQQSQLPQGLTKPEFFGEMLAVVAFCNLGLSVDQYEMSAVMRAFGVTSSDRPEMEAARTKHYEFFRREFTTPEKHQDFCITMMKHPFMVKVMRRGVPTIAGSDDRRQPEKIEFFGDILVSMLICKIPINHDKWGAFMFSMGVTSESMPAYRDHVTKTQKAIAENNTPQIAEMCKELRSNITVHDFME